MHMTENAKGNGKRIAVAYYSMEGHTEKVAMALSVKLNADLIRIETAREEGRGIKALKAALGLKSGIMPCKCDLSDVDFLVIACPVWGRKTPPYVNKYLSTVKNISGKPFSVMAEMKSAGADRTIAQVRKALEKKGMRFVSSTYTVESEVEANLFVGNVVSFARGIAAAE